jgi:hypothetical protein
MNISPLSSTTLNVALMHLSDASHDMRTAIGSVKKVCDPKEISQETKNGLKRHLESITAEIAAFRNSLN